MDSDVQPDEEEVLDDIGDKQEPFNKVIMKAVQLWHSINLHH